MKRLSYVIAFFVTVMAISGCNASTEYLDDIADLQRRVTALENLCSQMNGNISSLQSLATASQNGNYITSVTPISYGGETIGYTIAFVKGDPITIYNGKNGADGRNGTDGLNGTDGHTPQIGVRQDTDGVWYWTVDSNWLLDTNGSKVKAVGQDGKDGKDGEDGEDGKDGNDGLNGQDGADGITPQLKIEDDYWYVSTDKGATWTKLSKAKGEDGQDGTGGDSMFTHIDYSTSEDYVIFTLSNGTDIKVPTWTAFDRLNSLCNQMNSNLEGIGTILEAIDQSLFIKSVSTIVEGNKEIGYIITFSNDEKINIYHGKDGENGSGGGSGHTPQMGVRQHTDGIWYWTVDGEWLLDSNGGKVKAVGTDGQNGENGQDGITPQLKIENGYWYVSMDKGATWTQYGKATGEDGNDGDSFFKSVTQDENNVYFTLIDDTVLTLPKSSILEISFTPADNITLQAGVQTTLSYEVTSSISPVKVQVFTSSDIRAKVIPANSDGLTGTITIVAQRRLDEFSQVMVLIDNRDRVVTELFTTENGGLINYEKPYLTVNPTTLNVPEEGGTYSVTVSTNQGIATGTSSADWVTVNSGSVTVEDNPYAETRTTTVTYTAGSLIETLTINQAAKSGTPAYINIDYPVVNVPASGETFELNVTSNVQYQTAISDPWVSMNGKIVTVAENKTYAVRSATITFSYGEVKTTFTINQDAAEDDVLEYIGSNPNYHLSSDGGVITVNIRTNVEYSVTISADWITPLRTKTVREDEMMFSVAANNSTSARSGTITFSYGGVLSKTVSVHQYGKASASVDLGLPSGLKWATCNVGANAPEEYGDYFAWGETDPYYSSQHPLTWKSGKTGYNWASYKWCNGSNNTQTKYCTSSSYGTVDNKTVLDPEDDAAFVNWGGNWRMPTLAEWEELRTKCTWTWTMQNGVNGRLVTGPNGNSIFLPAAGYRSDTFPYLFYTGSLGYFWLSSLRTDYPDYAWCAFFSSDPVGRYDLTRYYGLSVRPVTE